MLQHRPRPTAPTPPAPEVPPGPSELVAFTDLDFHYGKDDIDVVTLAPGDTFDADPDLPGYWRVVIVKNDRLGRVDEVIRIDHTKVRRWSERPYTVSIPPRAFVPPPPAE